MPGVPEELVGKIVGGCRIDRLVGHGAMGAVYQGRHLALQKDVAVKTLAERLAHDANYVQRFVVEARLAAQIEHPNIVQVLNVGCEDGVHFIVMQFVPGESVSARLARDGPLAPQEAARVALGVARGLAAAHEKRIVHRDIKPANILLTAAGEVKVADLGLAKVLTTEEDSSITQVGETMGTPQYMPPEQAEDARTADARSDVYSLGCTLYHMLTGEPPFAAKTAMGVIHKHLSEDAPSVTSKRAGIPPVLSGLIGRMMAKSREARPQSMTEVAAELERIAETKAPSRAGIPRLWLIVGGAAAAVLVLALLAAFRRPSPAQQAFEAARVMWERDKTDFAGAAESFRRVAEQFPGTQWAKRARESLAAVEQECEKAAAAAFGAAEKAAQEAEQAGDYARAVQAWEAFPQSLAGGECGAKVRAAKLKAKLPLRIRGLWDAVQKQDHDAMLQFLDPEEVAAKGRHLMMALVRMWRGALAIGVDLEGWQIKSLDYSPDMKHCNATLALTLLNKFSKQKEVKDAPQQWVVYKDEWYAELKAPDGKPGPGPGIGPGLRPPRKDMR